MELPCLLIVLEGNSVSAPAIRVEAGLEIVFWKALQLAARFAKPRMLRDVHDGFKV